MDLARLTTLALSIALLAAAPATASTVRLDPGGGDESSELTYTAAAGEQNKLSVAVDGAKATIDDPGASEIVTQQGCTQVTPKRAVCDLQDSTETIQYVLAELGDGNDTFSTTAANTQFAGSRVNGGDGDDDLRGAQFSDGLNGGVGTDQLRGGPGDDFLILEDPTGSANADYVDGGEGGFDQLDAYSKRTAPVTVDLASDAAAGEAGEGDVLIGMETAGGGLANDVIRGDEGANIVVGGAGDDILDGRGGRDTLYGDEGDDDVTGGAGEDDISAGAGDDTITLANEHGVYDRFVACAEGNDFVTGVTEAFPSFGVDCERVDLGMGLIVPTLPRRVTTTYVAMSIPCPAAFRDGNGVCGGKLQVEPRLAFKRSAKTRFRTRYGAKDFRFRTASARITVPLNAAGRRELRKQVFRLQFTLRLKETATGSVRQFEWTEALSRRQLQQAGVG